MVVKGGRRALIVGLGNPGEEYENTRHNLGFLALRAFAEKCAWDFKKRRRFLGKLAEGRCEEKEVILLLPMTYMNLSGRSVRKVMDFFSISHKTLLVVVDDAALPFGVCRFRERGSAGGHNGLRDIESRLETREYARLRIGIGSPDRESLADYVLGLFTDEEMRELPEIIDRGVLLMGQWLKEVKEVDAADMSI